MSCWSRSAVIAFFLFRSLLGGNVSVPDVVGKTDSQATQTLQGDNLTVGTTKSVASSTLAKGVVVSTEPKAGDVGVEEFRGRPGRERRPARRRAPVVGQQLTQADAAADGAGLGYTVKYVSSNKPVGTVLAQDPAGVRRCKSTTKVQLTVSGTQTSVTVPSVLGQSPAVAGLTLGRAGLTVGTQTAAARVSTRRRSCRRRTPRRSHHEAQTAVDIVISNCSRRSPAWSGSR